MISKGFSESPPPRRLHPCLPVWVSSLGGTPTASHLQWRYHDPSQLSSVAALTDPSPALFSWLLHSTAGQLPVLIALLLNQQGLFTKREDGNTAVHSAL